MSNIITKKVVLEIISHEAIVREAYKDSKGIWTWGIGVTNESGYTIFPRYKDKPQSITKCLEIFKWLLEKKYVPKVESAFQGVELTEEQFAAALSFQYNTGRITSAGWVKSFVQGDYELAYRKIMEWRRPPEIIPRREKERDLFFKSIWSHTGTVTEYMLKKPSYTPDWSSAKKLDIVNEIDEIFNSSDIEKAEKDDTKESLVDNRPKNEAKNITLIGDNPNYQA